MTPAEEVTRNSKPTLRCLIIQIARFGDTLQSLMALRAAKELYPQLEIHFVAREKFSHAARRVPWIKSVIELPTETLLGPILRGEKQVEQSFDDIARWVAPLTQTPWDMIVNWSFSESSSYLTGLLPAKIKLGYTRRRDSSFSGADAWSHYIQAIIQEKIEQNIHLTDILTTQILTALQIHAGDPLSDGNSAATSKSFFALSLSMGEIGQLLEDPKKKWIGIQLGIRKNNPAWNPKNWSKLIQYITKRHPDYCIFLLGEESDSESARMIVEETESFIKKSNTLVSLVGKTSFDQWASVIGRCQWLFTESTTVIHLASVLGTRILNLLNGLHQSSNKTGPYGNGHYLVSSETQVTVETAYAAWTYAASEWSHRRQIPIETHFSQLGWSEHLAEVQIHRSRIRSTNDGGGVVFDPLIKRALKIEDWTALVLGQIARSWYCGWIPPTGQELSRESLNPPLIQKLRALQDSSEVLSKIFEKASRTAMSLSRKSATLRSDKIMGVQDREEIRQLAQTLSELEELIDRLARTHPPLSAFSKMSKVLMHHLQGTHLSDLGSETANCYKQLNEGITILKQWIAFSLNLIKPVAIQSAPISLFNKSGKPPENELL